MRVNAACDSVSDCLREDDVVSNTVITKEEEEEEEEGHEWIEEGRQARLCHSIDISRVIYLSLSLSSFPFPIDMHLCPSTRLLIHLLAGIHSFIPPPSF